MDNLDNGALYYRRLVDAVTKSDKEAALGALITEYRPGLLYFIKGIVKDKRDAEELIADVFLKLYIKKPKFSEKSTLKTWLYKIGYRKALTFLKRKKITVISYDDISDCVEDEADVEYDCMRNENVSRVRRGIEKVKHDEYRRVLYLAYIMGFSIKETGAIMKKSEKQVSNLLQRGKESLRKILEKEGGFDEKI